MADLLADFLAGPVRDNPILRQTAMPPATIGEGFSAGLGTPALGGLAVTQEQIRVYEEAARRGLGDRPRGRPTYEEMETMRRSGRQPTPESVLREYRTPMLSKDELEERYKDLGLKFEGPMSEGAAKILADTKKAELIRKDVMARLGAGGTVAGFGGGLLAMLMDPLEVSTAFIPVLGPASKGALVTRLGVMRGRIAAGAIEGFTGNLITEPFYAGLSSKLQLDYQMADAALNLAFGAGLGGIGGAVGGALARRQEARADMARQIRAESDADFAAREARARERVAERGSEARAQEPDIPARTPEAHIEAYRTAVAQAAQGRRIDVEEALELAADDRQTLSQFVEARGGLADDLPSREGQPDSRVSEERMAELARDAGFIEKPTKRALREALEEEAAAERLNAGTDVRLRGGAAEAPAKEGWVIVDRDTREAVLETRDPKKVDALNTEKYEAVPAGDYLREYNEAVKAAGGVEPTVRQRRQAAKAARAARDKRAEMLAAERVAAKVDDPEGDFSGDPRASKAADDIEDFDPFQEVEMLEEMIDEMRGGRAGGDILDTDGPWRDATVKVQDEDGNAANVNAGFAVDTLKNRLDQARQILECVNG